MSEVEWVEESDWSKVIREGARIRLCNFRDEHIFTVMGGEISCRAGEPMIFHLRDAHNRSEYYSSDGWTLFVERPVVELPTEPGYYLDKEGEVWDLRTSGEFVSTTYECHEPEECAPFHLLRPVDEVRAETAKEVLRDFLDLSWPAKGTCYSCGSDGDDLILPQSDFNAIAAAFGVSDE